MAVKEPVRSAIRARLMAGTDPLTGTPIMAYRSFNNVKTSAMPEDALETMIDLMSLQKHHPQNFEQIDYGELREQ